MEPDSAPSASSGVAVRNCAAMRPVSATPLVRLMSSAAGSRLARNCSALNSSSSRSDSGSRRRPARGASSCTEATKERWLHLVSVGTGQTRARISERLRRLLGTFGLATAVPASLIDSISREQDLLCRTLGHTLHGAQIDSEATEIHGLRQFTYARFNREFSPSEVAAAEKRYGGGFSLDNLRMIQLLTEEGRRFAEQVQVEHLL